MSPEPLGISLPHPRTTMSSSPSAVEVAKSIVLGHLMVGAPAGKKSAVANLSSVLLDWTTSGWKRHVARPLDRIHL
jgi:hypothetical protein